MTQKIRANKYSTEFTVRSALKIRIFRNLAVGIFSLVLLSGCVVAIPGDPDLQVVYAVKDIPADAVITPNQIQKKHLQGFSLPAGFFEDTGKLVGRKTNTAIPAGTIMAGRYLARSKQDEFESRITAQGNIVYSVKEISEGTTFKVSQLAEREIEQTKIPADALDSLSLVVGRKAKYDIPPGQIISQHDLVPFNPLKEK